MPAPTPVTKTFWDGIRGMVRWYAAWSTADEITDNVIIDVSALDPAPEFVKILVIDVVINGNIQVDFEFDADTDELIDRFIGQSDVTYQFLRDYSGGPNSGWVSTKTAAGAAGDVLLTTAGVASGDEVNAFILFERS